MTIQIRNANISRRGFMIGAAGFTFDTQLEAGRTWFFISGIVFSVSWARLGTVTARSAVRPRSSEGWTSWRS